MGCGKVYLLNPSDIHIQFLEDLERKRVKDYPCPECNCELTLIDESKK